ncbi:MAG: hypothetical protein AAF916_03195 [Planctomycetota bacterium]
MLVASTRLASTFRCTAAVAKSRGVRRCRRVAGGCGSWLVALLMAGCATVPDRPGLQASTPEGLALLDRALAAHGGAAIEELTNVAVAYDGTWHGFVERFQPVLVDIEHRGRSEERILYPDLWTGQRHTGPGGTKYVSRDADGTTLWYDGVRDAVGAEANDVGTPEDRRDAAQGVVDGYALFLLGPMYLAARDAPVDVAEPVTIDGRPCDQLIAVLRPGFGRSEEDRVVLAIDRADGLVRRIRFTFDALPQLEGTVADVLPSEYVRIDGIAWPTRFVEVVKNPLVNLTVHRWRVTGLDTNRGLDASHLDGPDFTGPAAAPAGVRAPSP